MGGYIEYYLDNPFFNKIVFIKNGLNKLPSINLGNYPDHIIDGLRLLKQCIKIFSVTESSSDVPREYKQVLSLVRILLNVV